MLFLDMKQDGKCQPISVPIQTWEKMRNRPVETNLIGAAPQNRPVETKLTEAVQSNKSLPHQNHATPTQSSHKVDENHQFALTLDLLSRGAATISILPANRFRRGLGERGRLRITAEVVTACENASWLGSKDNILLTVTGTLKGEGFWWRATGEQIAAYPTRIPLPVSTIPPPFKRSQDQIRRFAKGCLWP